MKSIFAAWVYRSVRFSSNRGLFSSHHHNIVQSAACFYALCNSLAFYMSAEPFSSIIIITLYKRRLDNDCIVSYFHFLLIFCPWGLYVSWESCRPLLKIEDLKLGEIKSRKPLVPKPRFQRDYTKKKDKRRNYDASHRPKYGNSLFSRIGEYDTLE